jgi:hypothetical protein
MQFMTIAVSVSLVLLFCFVPETQYPRTAQTPPLQIEDQSQSVNEAARKEEPAKDEKPRDEVSVDEAQPVIPAEKSYLKQLNPWSGINPNGENVNFLALFIRPFPLVFYPAVAYSSYIFGITVAAVTITVTQSPTVFESPPYNFTPGIQSLQHIPMLIGSAIGAMYGGLGTDILARYETKKNNGIFEPETRLPLLIGPLLILPAGLLMYPSLMSRITIGMDGAVQNGHHGRLPGLAPVVFRFVPRLSLG